MSTIAAPITAPGHAAVSVVRVSGPLTVRVAEELLGGAKELVEEPRRAVFGPLKDLLSPGHPVLDYPLAAYFKAPHSFTGEDVLEIHLHGSPYLVKRLLENLSALGVRSARPGEFTERAFHNGKLDLSQAEAVGDLIAAETEAQARVAREQLEGKLSQAVSELGEPLRDIVAEIEAYIDFPDEDINPASEAEWKRLLLEVKDKMSRYLDSFETGRICREGANVVLVGLPNAGKSSLLNALVGEERVIVTPIAGTTRDSVEERISLDGIQVRLWDTAGLAASVAGTSYTGREPDEVEKIGIEQSWKRAERAELVLYLFDLTQDYALQEKILSEVKGRVGKIILVANKTDQPAAKVPAGALEISAKTGAGLDTLRKEIVAALVGEGRRQSLLISNLRHFEALALSRAAIEEALAAIDEKSPPELTALSVRAGLSALDEIVGVTSTEDILGRIFSKFCIGK